MNHRDKPSAAHPAPPTSPSPSHKPPPGPEQPKPYGAYAPELCAMLVHFMGLGFSQTAFAGHIGVSRDTLKGWMADNPEFAAAGERGRAARTRFLEAQFLDGGTGAKVAAHVFALKNAAPEDWRDRPETEGGEKGPNISFTMPDNGRG